MHQSHGSAAAAAGEHIDLKGSLEECGPGKLDQMLLGLMSL